MPSFKVYLVDQWDHETEQEETRFAFSTREAAEMKAVELNAEIDAWTPSPEEARFAITYTSSCMYAVVKELTVDGEPTI